MYLVDVASLNLYDLYEYKFIMICEDVKMLCVCVCIVMFLGQNYYVKFKSTVMVEFII